MFNFLNKNIGVNLKIQKFGTLKNKDDWNLHTYDDLDNYQTHG